MASVNVRWLWIVKLLTKENTVYARCKRYLIISTPYSNTIRRSLLEKVHFRELPFYWLTSMDNNNGTECKLHFDLNSNAS